MTLLHLHRQEPGLGRVARASMARLFAWIGAAVAALHRAVVRAKLRGACSELLFRHDYDELMESERELKRFPQRPMILGDKWDF